MANPKNEIAQSVSFQTGEDLLASLLGKPVKLKSEVSSKQVSELARLLEANYETTKVTNITTVQTITRKPIEPILRKVRKKFVEEEVEVCGLCGGKNHRCNWKKLHNITSIKVIKHEVNEYD